MTGIPKFSEIDFQEPRVPSQASDASNWETPEGIAVKPAYGPDDLNGLDFLEGMPGVPPYIRGPYPTMYVQRP